MAWFRRDAPQRQTARRLSALRVHKAQERTLRRRLVRLGALVAVSAALLLGGRYLWQELVPPYEQRLEPVVQGALELASAGEGILVRPEHVQVAPAAGTVTQLEAAGRFVRAGTAVASLRGAGPDAAVTAERPGLVAYNVDGLELILTSALRDLETGVSLLGPDWLQRLPKERMDAANGQVQAGEPLFKLIDPSQMWVVASLPAGPLSALETGAQVQVQFPAVQQQAEMSVSYRSAAQGDRALVVLEAQGQFPAALLLARRTPVRLILARHEGFVVPRTAIAQRDDETGVWVQVGDDRRFVAVNVLGQTEQQAAVRGSLVAGDQVWVTTPRR